MTASDLASLASAAYGPQWQSALSREMRIALRTVQRWAADGIPKAATAAGIRAFLTDRARIKLAGPVSGADGDARDDAAFAECEPVVAALIGAGEDAGFHEAEILAAVLSIVIGRMADGAGIPATVSTLRQVIDGLKEQRDS
ncbi:hypothetical protein [uncultured Methylobacterium sp.]|uniref:hypothetical protein n=1 Tax=uncultured Methylobacterium sp. TaxID=157278 RepID=UPI0035CAAF59